ncbi:MAG: hypothetical protein P8165_18510 [Deltaproteobacteria bacterium]
MDTGTHHNLLSNPNAAYMFMEDGPGYKGVRLFLKKQGEEADSELLYSIRRRKYAAEANQEESSKFLVFFEVEKQLPLIGAGDTD